jgi:hypothetical protein
MDKEKRLSELVSRWKFIAALQKEMRDTITARIATEDDARIKVLQLPPGSYRVYKDIMLHKLGLNITTGSAEAMLRIGDIAVNGIPIVERQDWVDVHAGGIVVITVQNTDFIIQGVKAT